MRALSQVIATVPGCLTSELPVATIETELGGQPPTYSPRASAFYPQRVRHTIRRIAAPPVMASRFSLQERACRSPVRPDIPVRVKPATHDVTPSHAWQTHDTQASSPVLTHE